MAYTPDSPVCPTEPVSLAPMAFPTDSPVCPAEPVLGAPPRFLDRPFRRRAAQREGAPVGEEDHQAFRRPHVDAGRVLHQRGGPPVDAPTVVDHPGGGAGARRLAAGHRHPALPRPPDRHQDLNQLRDARLPVHHHLQHQPAALEPRAPQPGHEALHRPAAAQLGVDQVRRHGAPDGAGQSAGNRSATGRCGANGSGGCGANESIAPGRRRQRDEPTQKGR